MNAPLPTAEPRWLEEQPAIYLAVEPRTCRLWRTTRGGQGWRHYPGLGVLASLNY